MRRVEEPIPLNMAEVMMNPHYRRKGTGLLAILMAIGTKKPIEFNAEKAFNKYYK